MAQIKYFIGKGEQAIKEALGVEELVTEEGTRGPKAIIEYTVESKKGKTAIQFTEEIGAVITTEERALEGFDILTEKVYSVKLVNGESFEVVSPYIISNSSLAYRIFGKALSPFKAKYAPVRTSMASEKKEQFKAELAKYKAMKAGKEVSEESEISEDTEY